jgi:hypothetical protein
MTRRLSRTDEFKKRYSAQGIYGNYLYGSPWVNRGIRCAHHICNFVQRGNEFSVLCFGSGNGYEAVKFLQNGKKAYCVDLFTPQIDFLRGKQIRGDGRRLPFKDKSFDIFFSCETLEHIEEDWTDDILQEAKRVADAVFFTIADRMDTFDTHINLHDINWWISKFESNGFKISNAQWKPKLTIFCGNMAATFSWPDGILIHATC